MDTKSKLRELQKIREDYNKKLSEWGGEQSRFYKEIKNATTLPVGLGKLDTSNLKEFKKTLTIFLSENPIEGTKGKSSPSSKKSSSSRKKSNEDDYVPIIRTETDRINYEIYLRVNRYLNEND